MSEGYEHELGHAVQYLKSQEAIESIQADPYWPKWNCPWWYMTLMWEMGEVSKIPQVIIKIMIKALDGHYVKIFPVHSSEFSKEIDIHRQTACHCALGTMYQVLSSYGVNVDEKLPWIRSWFLKYQLPDGGLNCDNNAYTKENPKSSLISTLPPLEALLFYTKRSFTKEEENFLDKGAEYLLKRKLFRSISKKGIIINEEWLKLGFPRFYDYDILRGLYFIAHWAKIRKKVIPLATIEEAIQIIKKSFPNDILFSQRKMCMGDNTLVRDEKKQWLKKFQDASSFELLNVVSSLNKPSKFLTQRWEKVKNFLSNTQSL